MLNLIKPVILNLRSNRAKMCKHVNPCCIFSLFAFFSNQMTNLNKRQYCWKNELENELLLRNIPYIFFLLAQLYPKNLFSQLYMIFYSLLLFAPGPILCKQWDLLYTVHLVVKPVVHKNNKTNAAATLNTLYIDNFHYSIPNLLYSRCSLTCTSILLCKLIISQQHLGFPFFHKYFCWYW